MSTVARLKKKTEKTEPDAKDNDPRYNGGAAELLDVLQCHARSEDRAGSLTLGIREDLEELTAIATGAVQLLPDDGNKLEDRIWRLYGMIISAVRGLETDIGEHRDAITRADRAARSKRVAS